MAEIVLVRQEEVQVAEADREAVRRVLFGTIDGLGERARKSWRRFWRTVIDMEPGEIVTVQTHKARSGPFHRRHMKIEATVFESQERFENFEQFRNWLKVGAGHVTWAAGPKGGVVPIPKSISYAQMEEVEFREFHDAVIDFLHTPHAAKYLWPHLKENAVDMASTLLSEFGE